ncbi:MULTISPECIES: polymer-forming cytoskeletal protein [Myroides]|uniref:bactofilin family protein n=1 Tax=Myroides TaxID=76831 RepID=UPI00130342B3|nr:polymer-forming cytoskeletal protein [Myroides phaeus]
MFQKTKSGPIDQLGRTNRIIEETIIRGDIESVTDLRLDGVLYGNLKVKGRVVVGPKAQVYGNVECENADIEGIVEGKMLVSDLLHITDTATVKGDLFVGRLSVASGAVVEAKCDMSNTVNTLDKKEEKGESKKKVNKGE